MSAPDPSTYWEKRSALAEVALERLAQIIVTHFPATHELVQLWADEWTRLRDEDHRTWEREQQIKEQK